MDKNPIFHNFLIFLISIGFSIFHGLPGPFSGFLSGFFIFFPGFFSGFPFVLFLCLFSGFLFLFYVHIWLNIRRPEPASFLCDPQGRSRDRATVYILFLIRFLAHKELQSVSVLQRDRFFGIQDLPLLLPCQRNVFCAKLSVRSTSTARYASVSGGVKRTCRSSTSRT